MFRKSQIALTDLFIGLSIASILIFVVVFSWNRYTTTLIEDVEYREMQIVAFQAVDLLVKTKGEPENWEEEPENAEVIGLASSDRVLKVEKVEELFDEKVIDYSVASRIIGTGFYHFYLELKYIDGTLIDNYGESVPSDRPIVKLQRYVLYNGEEAILEFTLWKK